MPTSLKIVIGSTTSEPVGARPASFQHRLFHFAAFSVAELLLLLLASNRRQELRAAAVVPALGTSIELTQHFVLLYPFFEWWDVRDDLIGILPALAAVQFRGVRQKLLVGE